MDASGTTSILLDCDPGVGIRGADVDDGFALAWLKRSSEAQLVAVSVVGGNVATDVGVRIALGLLELDGDRRTPVHRGAGRPLVEDPRPWRERLDGRGGEIGGWDGLTTIRGTGAASQVPAALAIIEAALALPNEVTVVAVGPLTNLALALRLEPALAQVLRRIVVMGGAVGRGEPWSELNFGYDPEAAQIVLSSGASIVVVPIDITSQTCLTVEQNQLFRVADDPLVRFMGDAADPWIRWVMLTRHQKGCFLHDVVAAVIAVAPELCRTEARSVAVELCGSLTRGKLVVWDPAQPLLRDPPTEVAGAVDVVVELDVEAFHDVFVSGLLARGT